LFLRPDITDEPEALASAKRTVRGIGGAMFLLGALIMCYNLWMTVTSVAEKAPARSPVAAE
jgi:cbb3-type cytochrome oxidase subunit 1